MRSVGVPNDLRSAASTPIFGTTCWLIIISYVLGGSETLAGLGRLGSGPVRSGRVGSGRVRSGPVWNPFGLSKAYGSFNSFKTF